MIIHRNSREVVDLVVDKIPAVLYFTLNDQTFRYSLDRKCLDIECPYNNAIVHWMENHREDIKDILFNWSTNREIIEITDDIL